MIEKYCVEIFSIHYILENHVLYSLVLSKKLIQLYWFVSLKIIIIKYDNIKQQYLE